MENADVLVGILVGYNIHIGTGIRWGEDVHMYSVQCVRTLYSWGLGTFPMDGLPFPMNGLPFPMDGLPVPINGLSVLGDGANGWTTA